MFEYDEYPDSDDLLIESVMAPKPPERKEISLVKKTLWASVSLIIILSMLLALIAPIFFSRPEREDRRDLRTTLVFPLTFDG